jgi:hypothetical protein
MLKESDKLPVDLLAMGTPKGQEEALVDVVLEPHPRR